MKYKILLACLCLQFLFTGCKTQVSVEPGGAYTEASLATADQAILDASKTLDGFLQWELANSAFLARYPEVGKLAVNVTLNRDKWIKDAYAARDAYASALISYRLGKGQYPTTAKIDAALSLLINITQQIVAYKQLK